MISGHLILDNAKLCEAVQHWLKSQCMPGEAPTVDQVGTVIEDGATKFRFTLVKPKKESGQ